MLGYFGEYKVTFIKQKKKYTDLFSLVILAGNFSVSDICTSVKYRKNIAILITHRKENLRVEEQVDVYMEYHKEAF